MEVVIGIVIVVIMMGIMLFMYILGVIGMVGNDIGNYEEDRVEIKDGREKEEEGGKKEG